MKLNNRRMAGSIKFSFEFILETLCRNKFIVLFLISPYRKRIKWQHLHFATPWQFFSEYILDRDARKLTIQLHYFIVSSLISPYFLSGYYTIIWFHCFISHFFVRIPVGDENSMLGWFLVDKDSRWTNQDPVVEYCWTSPWCLLNW